MRIETLKKMFDACYQAKRARDLLPPLPDGVTSSYIHYLDAIQKLEKQEIHVKVSDISDTLNLPRPGVTRTVKEMEKKGYLQKISSPDDGRVTYITITETGKELSLKDLCGDDYIDTISEEIKTQMREQMAADETVQYWLDDPEVEEWNFDKIAEDQDFYVNEDGHIVVCFNEYDVAPGSMGCVEFTLNETANVK